MTKTNEADCPECELCCALGICCPMGSSGQRAALGRMLEKRGMKNAESVANEVIDAFVEAAGHGASGG